MSVRSRNATLGCAFFLTGVGSALLGATLPATLHAWSLSDSHGGLLLLAGWGGSTSGALFARGKLAHGAAAGLLLSAFGLFLLTGRHPSALPALYLIYGLGLGLTMTAISLLRSREAARHDIELVLNRLNLIWAAGACITPALALHSLHLLSVVMLYRALAVVFTLGAVSIFTLSSQRTDINPQRQAKDTPTMVWAPWQFCLYAATSVGLESAIGSWLTTYAERIASGALVAAAANSAFWLGLLVSRAAHSLQSVPWLQTRLARNLHVAAVGASVFVLIALPRPAVIPCAGLLSGLGLGPLYPYVLSVSLPSYRSTAVFVLAGVGASVVPWLTGTLSSAAGSLRTGLLVPAIAFALLIVSARSTHTHPGSATNEER